MGIILLIGNNVAARQRIGPALQ